MLVVYLRGCNRHRPHTHLHWSSPLTATPAASERKSPCVKWKSRPPRARRRYRLYFRTRERFTVISSNPCGSSGRQNVIAFNLFRDDVRFHLSISGIRLGKGFALGSTKSFPDSLSLFVINGGDPPENEKNTISSRNATMPTALYQGFVIILR